MSGVCTEQHKFHTSHQISLSSPKKSLRDIDIPPRKLLTRRAAADMFSDETILQKFLPHNNPYSDSDSDNDDPYSSDHFRMYEFKVRRCTRSRSHDWTDCPFAHPGEKARRRDPRRYHYSGTVCPEYRRGTCSRGDTCEFAHGVFECWLHPARYRTEACKDGKNCKRKVCFFAHTPHQLGILPVTVSSSNEFSPCKKNNNKLFLSHASGSSKCCLFCHCATGATSSPTSTLFGVSHLSPPMSPSSSAASPPLSPVKPRKGVPSVSRYGACGGGMNMNMNMKMNNHRVVSYKDVLTELMSSFENLSFSEGSPVSAAKSPNLPWLDVPLSCEDQQQFIVSPSASSSFDCEDQQQFILSPSTQSQTPTSSMGKFSFSSSKLFSNDNNKVVGGDINGSSCPAPDLGWVNELLM